MTHQAEPEPVKIPAAEFLAKQERLIAAAYELGRLQGRLDAMEEFSKNLEIR